MRWENEPMGKGVAMKSGQDSTLSDQFRYLQSTSRARLIHRSDDGGSTHL